MAHKLSPGEISSLVLEAMRNPGATARICKRHQIDPDEFQKWQAKFIRAGTRTLKPEVSKRGRSYTHEEKLAIVFAGLRHDEKHGRLLTEYHVSAATYHRWRDEFTAAGEHAFQTGLPRANPVATLIFVILLILIGIGLFLIMSTTGASCLYNTS